MAGGTQTKQGRISGKDVARYMLLPGFLPRLQDLGGSGFGYLAFLIAQVYEAVKILPAGHPFTNPANIGKFTVRQTIAAAAANVKVDRRHIDQLVIFFAILSGIVILALQFVLIMIAVVSGQAFAADPSFDGIFTTTQPKDDIAFMILDHVFGIPELYGSKVLEGGQTPLHIALQALFRFYNMAILIVAVLIFLYFILVVVTETAQTGSPFGQRFNSVYAPLRLVFAIGLLVPLNYGFNASQYITLFAAKLGSGMATNGWTIFNNTLKDKGLTPLGKNNKHLIADVTPPEPDNLAAFATVVQTCAQAYQAAYQIEIKGYIVVKEAAHEFESHDMFEARKITKNADVHVVFGEKDDQKHPDSTGRVRPYCGSMVIHLTATNPEVFGQGTQGQSDDHLSAGPMFMQDVYYRFARGIFSGVSGDSGATEAGKKIKALGERFAQNAVKHHPCGGSGELGDGGTCNDVFKPKDEVQEEILGILNPALRTRVKSAITKARNDADFTISDEILKRGWGGAGMWYNKIADAGGAMASAVKAFPSQNRYPEIMNRVRTEREQKSKQPDVCDMFSLDQAKGDQVKFDTDKDRKIAQAMADAYKYWCKGRTTAEAGLTGNAIWDAVHLVFGTTGLFDLRQNTKDEVHPLAQMVTVGRLLVESSIRNVMGAIGSSAFGGLLAAAGMQQAGAAFSAMSGFFTSIALIGLVAGFILFYILPFLPFIYFFFAVGKWVKTIFEAMVGAPLWALAHLRIDGDGFSGRSASSGYFLIFEIFIRPVLTVFGLIGGLAIFTGMAVILNELFSLVVINLTGAKDESGSTNVYGFEEMRRNVVDQFFFTIVYAVIMYMMAISAFKMIDLVPNNILRWMGAGVSSFSDSAQDATEGLVQYAAIGGYTVGGQLVGATQKFGQATGQLVGGLAAPAVQGSQGNKVGPQ